MHFRTCEFLFQQTRMKDALRRIIYVNGKWIYYNNLKYSKSWPTITKPGQQSALTANQIYTYLHQRMYDEMHKTELLLNYIKYNNYLSLK